MWFTKTADGYRGWFVVTQSNGSLRAGLVAGDFTATVINPADSTSLAPAVAQSATKSGLYFFDVTSGFITTNGVGEYGIVIEVDTFAGPSGPPHVRSALSEVLGVTAEDFDTLAKPGDAMDLVVGAVDAAAVATSGANEIRDAILSDSTPFAGANIDAAVSSRSSQTSQDSLRDAIIANDLTVAVGSSTTEVRTGATQATGFYDEMVLVVINSAGAVARSISAYNNTNGAFTVATLPFTPSSGDRVIVIALDQAASMTGDWTSAEQDQIRGALGIVGVQTTPVGGGDLQAVKAQADKIDDAATTGPAAATTGSLLDRLANKDVSKTYNQATDSLEAVKDRIG